MKRLTALILMLALALCLAACGAQTKQPEVIANVDTQNSVLEDIETPIPASTEPPVVAVTPTVVVTSYPVPSSTPEPTPTVAPTPTTPPVGDDGFAIPTALATEEERANAYAAYVQGSGINVRAGVGTGTDIIDVVNIGDKVMVLGEESGWTKVIFHNKVGYIYSPFIDTKYPTVNNNNTNNYYTTQNDNSSVTIIGPDGSANVVTDDNNSGIGVIIMG